MKIFTWKQRIIVFGTTLVLICVFSGAGYIVGRYAGNWKIGVATGVLLSYPLSQISLLRIMQNQYKSANKPEKNK